MSRRKRRKNNVVDFFEGFNAAYNTTNKVLSDFEMRKIMNEEAQTEEGYTEDQGAQLDAISNAKDDTGKPYYTLKATEDGRYQVIPNFANAEGGQDQPATIAPELKKTSFLGKTYDKPPTEGQQSRARMMAMSGVLGKYGDPLNSVRLRAAAGELEEVERRRADADELRQVFSGGGRNATLLASGPTDMADVTASNTPPQSAATSTRADGSPMSVAANLARGGVGATLQQAQQTQERGDLDAMLGHTQRAVATLMKQGRIEEAKRLADFAESEDGRRYSTAWLRGMRLHAIGDDVGALSAFEKLYNAQLYDDGRTVKMTPVEGGKQFRLDQLDAAGNIVGTKAGATSELARWSALALQPTKAVEFMAQQQGKRDSETAALDKALALEDLRAQREEGREDRRDERLQQRLDASERNLERRLSTRGRLTATQERANFEIDAAREYTAGLTPEEIRQRTTTYMANGRDNPLFDPALARAARLADRRKVGNDPDFVQRQDSRKPAAGAKPAPKAAAQAALAADPNMAGYSLGEQTPKGFKVLDPNGKHVGYLGRK